ncbi:MAG: MBL fold metallo-hydrolase [Thermaerobacter sp.]|nr:MBL fold metallo-hydrolase [Thermaerobacter sp.]
MEIAQGVYLLQASKGSYVYLVLGEEPTLIDTGFRGRADRILAEIAGYGMHPRDIAHIALTHHDVDHVGNARALSAATGAKIWASQEDLPFIRGEARPSGLRGVIQTIVPVEPVSVDETYPQGGRVGGLEVLPTPGHTMGHVSLRLGDILFAGDLVTSRGGRLVPAPGMLTADRVALRRSLREVGRLPFQLVCPAHGEPVMRASLWEALTGSA